MAKIIGSALPNIPWQEPPANTRTPFWRYDANPIIGRDGNARSNSVFNSAVVPFKDGFAGVFRCDSLSISMDIFAGFSKDGLHWDIEDTPIHLVGDDPEVTTREYRYDPRVCYMDGKYYVTWCNGYHGPTIGIAWTDDFKTFHQLENAFLPYNRSHNRGQVSQYYIAKSHEAIISDEDFDKVQSLLKMKAPHKPKVAEKLFDQKLYCAVCGTLFARKTRTSGAVVWGCRKHLNKSGLCPVKSVYETELCRAFLCMHNKLLINQEKIFEPLLNSLSHLKSYQEKLDTMRMGIQVEIQRLAKQKHNLERIYAQGLIEDSQYLERKALIEKQLYEKKEFLTRKPLDGNIDRLLKNTRQIKRLLGTCQPLMYFDKQVFTSLVSKVTIIDTSFEFELINGMRVSERRTSK